MANMITSLDAFDELFSNFVVNFLGMDKNKVFISYPDEGQPMPHYKDNVCFVHTSEESDFVQMYKNRQEGYIKENDKWKITQTSMRKISVQFTFYGSLADINAITLKELLYFPGTNDWLHQNNLAIIPSDIILENKIHEEINNRFWERAELIVGFYNSVTLEQETNLIETLNLQVIPQQ